MTPNLQNRILMASTGSAEEDHPKRAQTRIEALNESNMDCCSQTNVVLLRYVMVGTLR